MASSSSEPNRHSTNPDTLQESNHKKRRKIGDHNAADQTSLNLIPWRSHAEQQIYSSKLVEALRRTPPSPAAPKPTAARQVRQTAYRVLAAAAKGRTRWSRAILAAQRWKFQRRHHKKMKKAATGLKKKTGIDGGRKRSLPAVQKKARVLSRLVPGCRKVSFQNLLEETTDYISALEMQVRAMTALTELLAGGMLS